MFNSALIAIICALFTATVSLRADSACIAASPNGISDCGDEASRLARISGIEDVELNFFGSGAGEFQAFFKASSYAALGSESEKPALTPTKSSSGDSGSQDSGGGFPGGDCCGPVQPPSWSESFDSAPTGTPDTLLSKILVPGGSVADLPVPDPAPEPAYSVLLVLGAGLLFYAGRKGRSVNNAGIS
jgi:hypothetical protein